MMLTLQRINWELGLISAAKEGVKMLDDEGREKQTAADDLSEDIALEMLTRVGGRG